METVIAFVIGLLAGLVLFALLLPAVTKRVRAQHQAELEQYEDELAELRQERADDRETNRRLRRELAINTPDSLQTTREERDRAIDELDKLNAELRHATSELADRDRSLREARLAIHDIRVQLERDRFALGTDGEAALDEAVALDDSAAFDHQLAPERLLANDHPVANHQYGEDGSAPFDDPAEVGFDEAPAAGQDHADTLAGYSQTGVDHEGPFGPSSIPEPVLGTGSVGRHDAGPRPGSVFFDDYPLGEPTTS